MTALDSGLMGLVPGLITGFNELLCKRGQREGEKRNREIEVKEVRVCKEIKECEGIPSDLDQV